MLLRRTIPELVSQMFAVELTILELVVLAVVVVVLVMVLFVVVLVVDGTDRFSNSSEIRSLRLSNRAARLRTVSPKKGADVGFVPESKRAIITILMI